MQCIVVQYSAVQCDAVLYIAVHILPFQWVKCRRRGKRKWNEVEKMGEEEKEIVVRCTEACTSVRSRTVPNLPIRWGEKRVQQGRER
jgi:hypothetical protein